MFISSSCHKSCENAKNSLSACFRASSWNHSFCRHYPRRLSLTRPGGMREATQSAAPCRRQGGTACWTTARLFQILQTPLRRSLEQGRASRRTGPLHGPPRTSMRFFFHLGPRRPLRNRILTILSRILKLILRIFSYLPLTSRWSPRSLAIFTRASSA